MTKPPRNGIPRHGLDRAFQAEEARKSNLILEGRALREQRQDEAAAAKFAEAAEIEARLSNDCEKAGLAEKFFVHRFSAASCWAQAGNFYDAIALCQEILDRPELPSRLHRRVSDYADALRQRRADWYQQVEAADSSP